MISYFCESPQDDPAEQVRFSVHQQLSAITGAETIVRAKMPGVQQYIGTFQSLLGNVTISGVYDDIKLFLDPDRGWVWRWQAAQILVGNNVVVTDTANEYVSEYLAASGVPILGIPPRLQCTAGISPDFPDDLANLQGNFSIGASAFLKGGWRYQEGSDVVALPVRPLSVSVEMPAGTCDSPPIPTILDNTNTWECTASYTYQLNVTDTAGPIIEIPCDPCFTLNPMKGRVHTVVAEKVVSEWTTVALPDNPKGVIRMERAPGDYQALIQRCALPPAGVMRSSRWFNGTVEATQGDTLALLPFYPSAPFLATSTKHAYEEPFDNPSYQPSSAGVRRVRRRRQYFEVLENAVCACGPNQNPDLHIPLDPDQYCDASRSWNFIGAENTPSYGVPGLLRQTKSKLATYINTHVNPHYCFVYYFPPDSNPPFAWPVGTAHAPPSEYWIPGCTQWAFHTGVPQSERTKRRIHICLAPLAECDLIHALTSYAHGQKSWFWGVHRMRAYRPATIVSGHLYNSTNAGNFSAQNCTLTHGLLLTLSGGAPPNPRTVVLDLGNFSNAPWMTPRGLWAFRWGANSMNIAQIRYFMVNQQGASLEIANAPVSNLMVYPDASDGVYAGDWARDLGYGYQVHEGIDTEPTGVSAPTFAHDEFAHGPQLFRQRVPMSLRVEVTPANYNAVNWLNYPYLERSTRAYCIPLDAHRAAFVSPDGYGLLYGLLQFWDYQNDQLRDAPVVALPGLKPDRHRPSALDAFCWATAYWTIQNYKAFIAPIYDLFDSYELFKASSPSDDVARRELARHTVGYPGLVRTPQQPLMYLINGFSEMPPLAICPNKSMGPGGFLDGARRQFSYAMDIAVERFVSTTRLYLTKAPGDVISANETLRNAPGNWKITKSAMPIDNSENRIDYRIETEAGQIIANVYPWHGYYAVFSEPIARGPAEWTNDLRTDRLYGIVIERPASDSSLQYVWPLSDPYRAVVLSMDDVAVYDQHVLTGLPVFPDGYTIAWSPHKWLYVALSYEGNVRTFRCNGRLTSWQELSIVSGKHVRLCGRYKQDGALFRARFVPNTGIVVERLAPNEQSFTQVSTISPADDAPFSIVQTTFARKVLHIEYYRGGNLIVAESYDGGATWHEI